MLDENMQEYPKFTAKPLEKIDNGKGYWSYQMIGVFQQDSKEAEPFKIGEYKRNYSTFYDTFSAVRKGDRFFALYSPNYTGTRVMEIFPGQGFKDIGGEEPDSSGFCPTGIHIPTQYEYVNEQFDVGPKDKIADWSNILASFPSGSRLLNLKKNERKDRKILTYADGFQIRVYTGEIDKHTNRPAYKRAYGPLQQFEEAWVALPPKHGFVSGCIWGDDSSWKIEHFDLSRIEEGIIVRSAKFGYIELPENLTLDKAVNCDHESGRIKISIDVTFDAETGGLVDWYGLEQQIALGKPVIAAQDAGNKKYSEAQPAVEADLQARWKDIGVAMLKKIEDEGGIIQ